MSSLFFGLLLLLLLLGLRLLLSPGLASVTGLTLFHIIWQIVSLASNSQPTGKRLAAVL